MQPKRLALVSTLSALAAIATAPGVACASAPAPASSASPSPAAHQRLTAKGPTGPLPPSIAVTIVLGPGGDQALQASAEALLQRLQEEGWFRLAPASAAATPVILGLSPARNRLANVDCRGGARYQEGDTQHLLANLPLAASEAPGAGRQRARVASCLLSASRELAHETTLAAKLRAGPTCAAQFLEGEWMTDAGLAIRFTGPFIDPFSQAGEGQAAVIRPGDRDAEGGEVLYTKLRRMADCKFLATRHLWLDRGLHASPPHVVLLGLSRVDGTLTDSYEGRDTVYRRLAGSLPRWGTDGGIDAQ